MSKKIDLDAKIKEMELEAKKRIASGKAVTPKPKVSVKEKKALVAKRKIPIKIDGSGFKSVYCPQADFNLDISFCVGCTYRVGEQDNIVYCNNLKDDEDFKGDEKDDE